MSQREDQIPRQPVIELKSMKETDVCLRSVRETKFHSHKIPSADKVIGAVNHHIPQMSATKLQAGDGAVKKCAQMTTGEAWQSVL